MPSYTGNVQNVNDDYDTVNGLNGSNLTARDLDTLGPHDEAYAHIDTSFLSSATVNSATLYWYHVSYSKAKTNPAEGLIYMYNGVGFTTLIHSWNNGTTNPTAGWYNHALEAGELANINASASTYTSFRFVVPNLLGADRTWTIGAKDSTDQSAYLVVDYSLPSTIRRQRVFIIG